MKRLCLLLISLLLVGCIQTKAGESEDKLHNGLAVVKVEAGSAQGTGFVTHKGLILTADHVVPEDTNSMTVTYFNGDITKATIQFTSELDYAYLKPAYVPDKVTDLYVVYCCYPTDKAFYNSYGYPNGERVAKRNGVIDLGDNILLPQIIGQPDWIMYFKNIRGGMSGAPLIQKNTDDVYGILVMKNGSVAKAVPTKLMKNFPGGGANGGKSPSKN